MTSLHESISDEPAVASEIQLFSTQNRHLSLLCEPFKRFQRILKFFGKHVLPVASLPESAESLAEEVSDALFSQHLFKLFPAEMSEF